MTLPPPAERLDYAAAVLVVLVVLVGLVVLVVLVGLFRPRQRTWCFCPKCRNDLCSSGSFVSDLEWVTYRCSKCGHTSRWHFDAPVPILLDQ